MVGECIKLPSLGPGPLHMMDHSPQAKHLISQSGKINILSKYKRRMVGEGEKSNERMKRWRAHCRKIVKHCQVQKKKPEKKLKVLELN